MDRYDRIEDKIDKLGDKMDLVLERTARNEERIHSHSKQLGGIWSLLVAAFISSIGAIYKLLTGH